MPERKDRLPVAPDGGRRMFRAGAAYTPAKKSLALTPFHRPLVRRAVSDETYRRIYEQAIRNLEVIRHGD